ncbi:MAG: hypothetical protein LBB61_03345 [Treponema sp.]|jgi:hypothetical protein|nr:hypothetical protein [Treponema sp.]
MRKFTLFMAALLAGAAVYAEDAVVLPAATLRVDADASVGFVREGWDADGGKIDAPDAVIIGASFGVSYGFTGWFTAAIDWSPGVTDTDLVGIDIGSDGDGAAEIYEGLSDFSVKAQFQIAGDGALLPGERFRMRFTPGIVIPFPGIDDKDALGNHTWGVGGDVSLDALVTDTFFVNVFSEVYWFPLDNKSKTNNEWEFTLEAGPHYHLAFGGTRIAFALPVNWKVSPENDKGILIDGVSSHLLTVRPSLTLKLTRPFAVDIGIEYTLPLYGKNNYAAHTVTVKAPVYFNFAKNKGGE